MKKIKKVALWVMLAVLLFGTGASGSGTPIKIGVNFELFGGVGWLGQTCLNAIKMYYEQLNAAGGVLGQRIELVVADNHANPSGAEAAAQKLIEKDKVVAILGPYSSKNSLGAARAAQRNGVAMLTPTATELAVTAIGDYIFRECFVDSYQGTVIARFALNHLKITSAAVINNPALDYSRALTDGFREAFQKGGGQIVAEESVQAGKETIAAKVLPQNPGLIFAPLDYQDAALLAMIIRRDLKLQLPILGGEGWNASNLTKAVGAGVLNDVYFCDHYSAANPAPQNLAFVAAYRKKFGKLPDTIAASAYDAAAIMAQAIAAAGDPEPAKIREAMAGLKFTGVTGSLRFDAARNPVKTGVIIKLQNGAQVFQFAMEPETGD